MADEHEGEREGRTPRSLLVGFGGVLGLFGLIYLLGLRVLAALIDEGVDPGTETNDPGISVAFVVVLLVMTGVMLLAFRRGLGWVIRAAIVLVAVGLATFVLDILLPSVFRVGGIDPIPLGLALLLGVALVVHPAWYVLNAVGVLLGAGAIALFGLSLGVLPALVLLGILAVYDAVSVYGTKHMLSLAEGAFQSHMPVMLIVPTAWSTLRGSETPLEEEEVVVIGLGDAVIPGILVGAALLHGPSATVTIGGIAASAGALGTIVGIGVGVLLLFVLLGRGGAHPGLPLLNSGAVAGYLVGTTIVGVPIREAIGLVAVIV